METSLSPYRPLGSPSFIEQHWKQATGKENASAKRKAHEMSRDKVQDSALKKTDEMASTIFRDGNAPASPVKPIPSFIATLSPKKNKVGSPLKNTCPRSPDKSATLGMSQTALWAPFTPLHCSQMHHSSAEVPLDQVRGMLAKIKATRTLPPLLAQGALLTEIVKLAYTISSHQLVHYKKGTDLVRIGNACPPQKGLAGSFFAASFADKIYFMVSNRDTIGRGSLGKATAAAGLVFKKTGSQLEFEGHYNVVKFTIPLKDSESNSRESVINRVMTRVQAAKDLADVPHVANPYFHGLLVSCTVSKMVLMYPRFGGDLLSYRNLFSEPKVAEHLSVASHSPVLADEMPKDDALKVNEHFSEAFPLPVLTEAMRKHNTMKVAEHLSIALQEMHARNYVHRDIKAENLLVNWTAERLLETVKLADFDLCTNAMNNQLCGTLQYLAPEMMAKAFKSIEIAKALEVEDLSSLFGPSLDTWGLGLVLHDTLYGCMPDHVYLLIDFVLANDAIQEANEYTPPERVEEYKRLADEAKEKWIATMLAAIKKDKEAQPPGDTSWKSFIQSLLLIDPRKRPNDAAIRHAVDQLKTQRH